MKSRITGKQIENKENGDVVVTVKKMKLKSIFADENYIREISDEEKEIIEIIKSGKKKTVPLEIFIKYNDGNSCSHCMNFNYEDETCKKNMPNIDPWYTKDNNLLDECEEWDYIYKTDDED